ncbi:hypothetical protein D3C76_1665060 [compost metagenome]
MPQGMARHGVDIEVPAEHADLVVVMQGLVPRRDVFAGRAVNGGVRRILQRLDAADMIMVMVGDQDIAQDPARMGLEPGLYRCGVTRVDHGAALGGVVL